MFRYNFALSRRQYATAREKCGMLAEVLAARVTKVSLAQNTKG
jgi:hypothetical protein